MVSRDAASDDAASADGAARDGAGRDGASSEGAGLAVASQQTGRRWLILFVGLIAMTAGCTFQYGLAYLIPALRHGGFSLELASILVACPTGGLLLTLIGWGAAADRWGERVVLASGLGLAGLVLGAASFVHGAVGLGLGLGLAGAAGGSVFAASGRLILGWFARHERGLAMGIRQSSQPLGVALAAAALPALGAGGTARPLLFLGGFCVIAAILVVALVRDPDRTQAQPPQPQPPQLQPSRRSCRRSQGRIRPVLPRRTGSPCSGVYTRQARCWSCRSSLSRRLRWSSSWTRAAGQRWLRAVCWQAHSSAARPRVLGPVTGPTGRAGGCGRCELWRSRPALACSRWQSRRQLGHRPPFPSCSPAVWWPSARTGWPSPPSPSTPAPPGPDAHSASRTPGRTPWLPLLRPSWRWPSGRSDLAARSRSWPRSRWWLPPSCPWPRSAVARPAQQLRHPLVGGQRQEVHVLIR